MIKALKKSFEDPAGSGRMQVDACHKISSVMIDFIEGNNCYEVDVYNSQADMGQGKAPIKSYNFSVGSGGSSSISSTTLAQAGISDSTPIGVVLIQLAYAQMLTQNPNIKGYAGNCPIDYTDATIIT